ncbi:ATP-binding protein [Comamonas odontotermitis]|uniref:ATP-binding protein n=1 Tax=Comamonas odontotermitis TaxID=379895 RepID=UPI00366A8380
MQTIEALMRRADNVVAALNPQVGEPVYATRNCDKHGEYPAKQLIPGRFAMCPTCRAESEEAEKREREAAAAAARRSSHIARLGRAGIPERFHDRTLENFEVENEGQRKALDFALDYTADIEKTLKSGRSAVFIGKPGTGKTHLAIGIGRKAMQVQKADVLFITVMRAIRSIKDTWAKDSEQSESQAIEALVAPDLLILDEVGVQYGSDFEKNMLFDVLNDRYEKRRPTIFLSNLNKQEVAAYLGERVMDRLREDGGAVIPFTWDSYRNRNKEQK